MSFFSAIGDFLSNPNIKGSNADESSGANPDIADTSSPGIFSKMGDLLNSGAHSVTKGLERVNTFLQNYDPLTPSVDPNNPKAINYAIHGFAKGASYIPDAIANALSGTASKAYEKMFGEKSPIYIPHDPFESALNAINPADANLKPAQGYLNNLAEGGGNALGTIASAGALTQGSPNLQKFLGYGDTMTPASASTIGGLGTQVAANPIIQQSDLPHPLKAAASTAFGIAGGLAGGKIASKFSPMADTLSRPSINDELPEIPETPSENALPNDETAITPESAPKQVPITAAQAAQPGSPEAAKLTAKQLDLASKSPKAAQALQGISQAQHQDIADALQGQEAPEAQAVTGQKVKDEIIDTLKTLRDQKNADYADGKQQILDNYNAQQKTAEPEISPIINEGETSASTPQAAPKINVDRTLQAIDDHLSKTAETTNGPPTELRRALDRTRDLVESNANDPEKLMNAKTTIQNMTSHNSDFHLGTQQSTYIDHVAQQLDRDIEDALPGYADLNAKYRNDVNNINALLDGSSKVNRLADTHPEQVVRQIFEKTSPEVHDQLMAAVSPQTGEKAADMYLNDVFKRGVAKPTSAAEETMSNIKGPNGTTTPLGTSQFQAMGDILKKNRDVLGQTLPAPQLQKVDQAIQGIDQNAVGQPKGTYTVNAYRAGQPSAVNVGQLAAASTNPQMAPGILAKMGDVLVGGPIKRNLDYNEMLTGQSPMSQIGGGLARAGLKAGAAGALNAPIPPKQQAQPQITPPNLAQPGGNVVPINANQPNAFDNVLARYGIDKNSANSPQNAFDAVLQKYGINDNSQASKTSQQSSLDNRALSQDELDFIHQKLQNHDVDSLVNFKKSFNDYQQGYDPLLKTLRKRESGDNYQNMKNPFGYVGAYQFGASALETVGLLKPGASRMGNSALRDPNNWNVPGGLTTFLNTPSLQDSAAKMLLDANKQTLTKAGVINDNTPVATRNGYLAAAHLKGAQGAINLFHGINSHDAFGTTAQDYFKMGAAI